MEITVTLHMGQVSFYNFKVCLWTPFCKWQINWQSVLKPFLGYNILENEKGNGVERLEVLSLHEGFSHCKKMVIDDGLFPGQTMFTMSSLSAECGELVRLM